MSALSKNSTLYQLAQELKVSPSTLVTALRAAGVDLQSQLQEAGPPKAAAETAAETAAEPALPTFTRPARAVVVPATPSADPEPSTTARRSIYAAAVETKGPAPASPAEAPVAAARRAALPPRALPAPPVVTWTAPRARPRRRPEPPPPSPRAPTWKLRMLVVVGVWILLVGVMVWQLPAPSFTPFDQARLEPTAEAPRPATVARVPGPPPAPRPAAAAWPEPARAPRITGRVLDAGVPAAYAVVRAIQGRSVQTVRTDAAGTFRLQARPGLLALRATYARRTRTREIITRPGERKTVDLRLPRLASLRLNWNPIGPLRVVLRRVDVGDAVDAVSRRSDLQASDWIRDLAPGRYRLAAYGEAGSVSRVVDLEPGTNAVDLALRPLGSVSFSVGGAGGPIADASVDLRPPPALLGLGGDGVVRLTGLPLRLAAGRWTAIVSAPGHASRRLTFAVGSGRASEARVSLGPELVVTIPGYTAPLAGVLLGSPGARLLLDADRASLVARGLPTDDEATILLRRADGRIGRVALNAKTDRAVPIVEQASVITGFLSSSTGEALGAGFEVRAEHEACSGREQAVSTLGAGGDLLRGHTFTDEAGAFRLGGLPAGTWILRVRSTQHTLRLRAGKTTTLLVQLK